MKTKHETYAPGDKVLVGKRYTMDDGMVGDGYDGQTFYVVRESGDGDDLYLTRHADQVALGWDDVAIAKSRCTRA